MQQSNQQLRLNFTYKNINENDANVRLYRARKQSDQMRKKIIDHFKKIFTFLTQNPQSVYALNNEISLNSILNETNSNRLIELLNTFNQRIKLKVQQNDIWLNQTPQQKQLYLNALEDVQEEIKKTQTDRQNTANNIENIHAQNDAIEQKLKNLLQQYWNQKIVQLQNKKASQNSYRQTQKLKLLSQNWQRQIKYIQTSIIERAEFRKQQNILIRGNQLLQIEIQKQQQNLLIFKAKQQRLNFLVEENKKLQDKINYERQRKSRLDQTKATQVQARKIKIAPKVIQKWQDQKKSSYNLLQNILQQINQRMPLTKLKDVNEIIKAAQEYYKSKQRIHQNQNDGAQI